MSRLEPGGAAMPVTLRKTFSASVDLGVRLDPDADQLVIDHAGLNQRLVTMEVFPEESPMADRDCCYRIRVVTWNDRKHATSSVTLSEDGEVMGGGWSEAPYRDDLNAAIEDAGEACLAYHESSGESCDGDPGTTVCASCRTMERLVALRDRLDNLRRRGV